MKERPAYAAIHWFEQAIRAHENLGATPPKDHEAIQHNYEAARKRMAMHLTKKG